MLAAGAPDGFTFNSRDLGKLVTAGMPKEGRNKFDLQKCKQWMRENEVLFDVAAGEDEIVATTRQECGRLLGVNERTISTWQKDPDFPGSPGEPGAANGYYPINKIKIWREGRKPEDDDEHSNKAKLDRLRIAEKELDVLQRLDALEDAERMALFFSRVCSRAKNHLNELPDHHDARTAPLFDQFASDALDITKRCIADAYAVWESGEEITDKIFNPFIESLRELTKSARQDNREASVRSVRDACLELEELILGDSDELTVAEQERRERDNDSN